MHVSSFKFSINHSFYIHSSSLEIEEEEWKNGNWQNFCDRIRCASELLMRSNLCLSEFSDYITLNSIYTVLRHLSQKKKIVGGGRHSGWLYLGPICVCICVCIFYLYLHLYVQGEAGFHLYKTLRNWSLDGVGSTHQMMLCPTRPWDCVVESKNSNF